MKKLILITLFSCFCFACFSQISGSSDQSAPPKSFFLGFQYSTGIFFPGDVNDYIDNYLDSHNMILESGISSIFINQCLAITGLKMVNNNFGLQGGADIAFAPKMLAVTNGDSKFFTFWRFSPWLGVNLYAGSFCLSGKGMLNIMGFENYDVTKPGFNITASYGVNISSLRLSPFIAFDYAKAKSNNSNFELNYTDVRFGFEFLLGVK